MENGRFHKRSMSAERPLPLPSDTPYQTPSISSPRVSSFGSPAAPTARGHAPGTPNGYHNLKDANAPGDAEHDAEQFTPTLHASLVSEILNLRRELDTKRNFIADLELNLASCQAENDTLQSNIKRSGKETRTLKRELQLHEDGATSAMGALSKERDDVKEANNELRKRLETIQKKLRTQEEDMLRFKSDLERERNASSADKRTIERRAELAEQRLKAVVEEVAASQSSSVDNSQVRSEESRPTTPTENTVESAVGSPEVKRHSKHYSKYSLDSPRGTKPSLADELDMSDEDTDDEEGVKSGKPTTLPEASKSGNQNQQHASLPSLEFGEEIGRSHERSERGTFGLNSAVGLQKGPDDVPSPSIEDRVASGEAVTFDLSVIHDAFKSPLRILENPALLQELLNEAMVRGRSVPREVAESAAPGPVVKERPASDPTPPDYREQDGRSYFTKSTQTTITLEDSSQAQRAEHIAYREKQLADQSDVRNAQTEHQHSIETGSDVLKDKNEALRQDELPASKPAVPAIMIHPASRPTSSEHTVLPPNTRTIAVQAGDGKMHTYTSIGCQAGDGDITTYVSNGCQTGPIQIDKRGWNLPPHLLPSSLHDPVQSGTQASVAHKTKNDVEAKGKEPAKGLDPTSESAVPERNMSRSLTPLAEAEDEATPVKGASIKLSQPGPSGVQRRGSGRPDSPASEYGDESDAFYPSDQEQAVNEIKFGQAGMRHSKYADPSVPARVTSRYGRHTGHTGKGKKSIDSRSGRSSLDTGKRGSRPPTTSETASQYQNRLAYLTRHGSTASRTQSITSLASSSNISKGSGPRPPFVIPSRTSSREPSDSIRQQREQRGADYTRGRGRVSPTKRGKERSRSSKQSPVRALRKAISTAAFESSSASEHVTALPQRANLALNGPTTRNFGHSVSLKNLMASEQAALPSTDEHRVVLSPTGGASVGSYNQHNTIDSTRACSIGTWMYKYIRKNSSFGGAEAVGDANKTSDARHKRWVWIIPSQKTLLWSKKQPSGEQAVLGKSAKKLSVSSVLDVKDETAPPKEAKNTGIFDRSIIILAPERALKLTAMNKETHFQWMTALQFLSHQSPSLIQNIPDLASLPLPPPIASPGPSNSSSGRSRASSFRNAFKSSRSKASSQQNSGVSTPVVNGRHPVMTARLPTSNEIPESAFAPTIPRIHHSRKRSATGPSQGRSGQMKANGTLSGYPVSSQSSQAAPAQGLGLMPVDVSAQGQTISGGSSYRSVRTLDDESAIAEMELEDAQLRTSDLSPRPSGAGADFGGNAHFFDAASVMQMNAFSQTNEGRPASRPSKSNPHVEAMNARRFQGHLRQESSASFIGPPDIGRHRHGKRATGPIKRDAWKNF